MKSNKLFLILAAFAALLAIGSPSQSHAQSCSIADYDFRILDGYLYNYTDLKVRVDAMWFDARRNNIPGITVTLKAPGYRNSIYIWSNYPVRLNICGQEVTFFYTYQDRSNSYLRLTVL